MIIYLINKFVKIGMDDAKGGAICYISKANSNENIINTWDCGRLIQQSYYGGPDGSKWNGNDWCWNPVQGGSWNDQCSEIISLNKVSETEINVKTIPRNWGGCQLCDDVIMETNIKLVNSKININCSMTYDGKLKNITKHQEIPACFVNSKYSTLVYRDRITKKMINIIPEAPGSNNIRKNADPKLVGYVDPSTNEGLFIYSPKATLLTAYRVDIKNNPPESNCSYFAPLMVTAIKGPCTISYDYSIMLDYPFK